jgi:hypothetical protein
MNLAAVLSLACLGMALVASAGAAASFDGVYKGTQRTIRTNNSAECSHIDLDNTTITVKDNHFTRVWTVTLDVDVAADGTFYASKQPTSGPTRVTEIKGKIVDGTLEADIGGRYCAGHLSLKKS